MGMTRNIQMIIHNEVRDTVSHWGMVKEVGGDNVSNINRKGNKGSWGNSGYLE